MERLLTVVLNLVGTLAFLASFAALYQLATATDIEFVVRTGLETLALLLLARVCRGYVDAIKRAKVSG